jgi:hypothetical protein
MKRLNQYIPEEAQARMKSLYTLTDGIYEGQKHKITTGKFDSVVKDISSRGGAISKLYNVGAIGAKVAAAEVPGLFFGTPGLGAAAVLSREATVKFMGQNKSAIKAADDVLSSPKLRASMIAYAKSDGKSTAATQAADMAMKKAPVFQKWLATVDDGVKERIKLVGPTNYFFHDNSYDKATEPDPVSMDDIRATAKQYGVSEQEVIDHVKKNGGKIQ